MIRYYVYRPGETSSINDPERSTEHFANVSWSSMWPKGYGTFTATVKRNIFDPWQIKTGYRIIAREGHTTLYDGRLSAPKKSISNGEQTVTLEAQGWFVVLNERMIHKRWKDRTALERMVWPSGLAGTDDQELPNIVKSSKPFTLHCELRKEPETLTLGTAYQEQYGVRGFGPILSVDYEYNGATGQSFDLILLNDDNAAAEEDNVHEPSATPPFAFSGSRSVTFSQGDTDTFTLSIESGEVSASYDSDQWVKLKNMVVKTDYVSTHRNAGSPTYSPRQLVEDVLLLARESDISADMTQVFGDTTGLDEYVTKDDKFQTAASVIEDIAAKSDASNRTYGLAIWGGDGSNDSLPQAYFSYRDDSKTDYVLQVRDCSKFDLEETDSEIFNWIIVEYKDSDGNTYHATPNTDITLKDTTSIASYGKRAKMIDAGESSESDAIQMGTRYLAYHKEPLQKGEFSVVGDWVSRLRAGDVFYFQDTGLIVFARDIKYDVNSKTATITPELPADNSTMPLPNVAGRGSFEA